MAQTAVASKGTPQENGQFTYQVRTVAWKGFYKRLRLEPDSISLDVPLSACLTRGDQVAIGSGDAWVICKNGNCKILQPYVVPDSIDIAGIPAEILVKEITEEREHTSYQALADYHYRGKVIHGRTARLIARTFNPEFPPILGYIELATPFFMNKPRARILDASFTYGPVTWDRWDINTLRKYIHVVVRIARTVVAPEFRGANIGQLLVKHAMNFARHRWQVSGYMPYFIEISADMLKYVPFAERAGMSYVGETEGNLKRVASDMRYLIRRFGDNPNGKAEFESISGILDQQIARMDRSLQVMHDENLDVNRLCELLDGLSQRTVLSRFALFHGIVSLPKPHYMAGLFAEGEEFLAERVRELHISNQHTPPRIDIDPISGPLEFENISIDYTSTVRRTFRTHAVQQAFDISPDDVHTSVIRSLSLTVHPGDVVLILGPSGSGKTSLLELIETSTHSSPGPVEGSVRRPENYEADTFRAFRSKKPLIDALGASDVRSALYLLGLAGLSEPILYLKRFQELSRGQQYRAMLARLIASRSNVWIADEFCANLDPATASIVADNVQRAARRFGVTVFAAAPHCDSFLHSLQPDLVVLLSSSIDHSVVRGQDYLKAVKQARETRATIPHLRVRAELLLLVKTGVKNATVRKGRRRINPGLLLLSDGRDFVTVTVVSSVCKRFSHLSDEDAESEGLEDSRALKQLVKEIYPDLRERSLVTVIRFEPLLNEWPTKLRGGTPDANRSVVRG